MTTDQNGHQQQPATPSLSHGQTKLAKNLAPRSISILSGLIIGMFVVGYFFSLRTDHVLVALLAAAIVGIGGMVYLTAQVAAVALRNVSDEAGVTKDIARSPTPRWVIRICVLFRGVFYFFVDQVPVPDVEPAQFYEIILWAVNFLAPIEWYAAALLYFAVNVDVRFLTRIMYRLGRYDEYVAQR